MENIHILCEQKMFILFECKSNKNMHKVNDPSFSDTKIIIINSKPETHRKTWIIKDTRELNHKYGNTTEIPLCAYKNNNKISIQQTFHHSVYPLTNKFERLHRTRVYAR